MHVSCAVTTTQPIHPQEKTHFDCLCRSIPFGPDWLRKWELCLLPWATWHPPTWGSNYISDKMQGQKKTWGLKKHRFWMAHSNKPSNSKSQSSKLLAGQLQNLEVVMEKAQMLGVFFKSCFGVSQSRTGQAFVRIFRVLVHIVIRYSVFRDGLHLHPRSMRQHPQVLKEPLPKASHRQQNQLWLSSVKKNK